MSKKIVEQALALQRRREISRAGALLASADMRFVRKRLSYFVKERAISSEDASVLWPHAFPGAPPLDTPASVPGDAGLAQAPATPSAPSEFVHETVYVRNACDAVRDGLRLLESYALADADPGTDTDDERAE